MMLLKQVGVQCLQPQGTGLTGATVAVSSILERPASTDRRTACRFLPFPLSLAVFTHSNLSQGVGTHSSVELCHLPSLAAWGAIPSPGLAAASRGPQAAVCTCSAPCSRMSPPVGFFWNQAQALECDHRAGPGPSVPRLLPGAPQRSARGRPCFSQPPSHSFPWLGVWARASSLWSLGVPRSRTQLLLVCPGM